MKIKHLFIACGLVSLVACNDDFMEKYPLDRVTDENFWKSESDMKLYLNTLYPKYIKGHGSGWSDSRTYPLNVCGSPLMYGDVFSDNAVKSGSEDDRLCGNYKVPTGASNSGWDWSDLRAVNYFLARYGRADLPDETKNKWAAEAYFFKAWEYYKKVLYFGDVPWIVTDLNTDSEELYAARTPRAEVMDSVLWCIDRAVAYLPEKGKEETGRLNKDHANALKSRICLFEGTFRKYHTELGLEGSAGKFLQACVTACEALLGKYKLYEDKKVAEPYWTMFAATDLSANPEVILYRKYVEGENGHAAQRYYDQNNSNRQAMGATRGLVDEYLCIDGNPIYTGGTEGSYVKNPNFLGYGKWTELENRDPRLTQTVCRPGEHVTVYQGGVVDKAKNGVTYPQVGYSGSGTTVTGYRIIKHWMGDQVEQDRVTNGIQPGIEFRYAEILLNYAEAKYVLDGTLSQADVDLTVNALRKRAGFDFEAYPAAWLTVGNEPADPRLDGIYREKLPYEVPPLLREIRRERRVELAMENRRYEDLMRWKAGNLLTVPLRGMLFGAELQRLYDGSHSAKPEIATKAIAGKDVFPDADGFIMAYPRSAHVTNGILPWEDYRYYFPLPKEELLMNTQLVQNTGWEGK